MAEPMADTADNHSNPSHDARDAMRRRVLLSGKIAYGDGAFSLDCSIRDQSQSGARLGIRGSTVLPKSFYLIDLRAGTAYDCELVWRNATQAGVKFHGMLMHTEIKDPNLQYLRRLYVEACLR